MGVNISGTAATAQTALTCLVLLLLNSFFASALGGTTSFHHIVLIVQENRTPDNLFQGLCTPPTSCSTTLNENRYDIQTANWLNKTSPSGVTQPFGVPLANSYDLGHGHISFVAMCDSSPVTGQCRMDGAAGIGCGFVCVAQPQFGFVENTNGILAPYLALARQYGWANRMFQTNQGPSFPAHQFLFGATSAPNAEDDHAGIFASENMTVAGGAGCAAPASQRVQLIDANGIEDSNNFIYPCFEHTTVADLLSSHGFSWRYYTPLAGSIWTAPNAINHICQPAGAACTGLTWQNNVDLISSDILSDIAQCNLRNVSWVIPTAQNSDHAHSNTGGGPSWVASIVNAVGTSACKDGSETYWTDTAIVITWDDWGGWYDHVKPPISPPPQAGYQYGFRVPLIVVSAYTPQGYIDNNQYDFGSIVRFIEHNALIRMGALTFADARAKTDLLAFFDFSRQSRPFKAIPSVHNAQWFLNDKAPQQPPDDD